MLAVAALVKRFPARASFIRAETAYLTYWLGVVLLLFASYVGSTIGTKPGSQYFTVVVYALAALAPLVLPQARVALVITTTALLLYCTASFVSTEFQWSSVIGRPAIANELTRIERIAATNHATVGYADFWSEPL